MSDKYHNQPQARPELHVVDDAAMAEFTCAQNAELSVSMMLKLIQTTEGFNALLLANLSFNQELQAAAVGQRALSAVETEVEMTQPNETTNYHEENPAA